MLVNCLLNTSLAETVPFSKHPEEHADTRWALSRLTDPRSASYSRQEQSQSHDIIVSGYCASLRV